jgi:penicillin-binding protein 1A
MEGQGANVALPIFANFMKKVYADKELGYSEKENFDVPEEYKNPCTKSGRRDPDAINRQKSESSFDEYFR